MIAQTGKENSVDEILPNLYLGRRLTHFDKAATQQHHFAAVLDLTSEFGKCLVMGTTVIYKCIPLLDTFAPTVEQLNEGVDFIAEHIKNGPVYVHCAMGHGRSATFVAAYLIAAGITPDVASAERYVQTKRAKIDLHESQRKALEAFAGNYLQEVSDR